MSALKPVYKVVRSIVISLIMLVVVLYVGLYVLLSLPSVQNEVKTIACEELSKILGGKLNIDRLSVSPFSEILLNGVSLQSPQGETVAHIDKVAAGIDLSTLLLHRRIVLNYAEIISLEATIIQSNEGGPLNIQFLIDALSPKDKTKPPTKFDLRFRNIIIRRSEARFYRPWLKDEKGETKQFSDIQLSDLRLNLSIPTLKNDDFRFDIRNLQANLQPGTEIRSLTADVRFKKNVDNKGKDRLVVNRLNIELPTSNLHFGDFQIDLGGDAPINATVDGFFTPSDIKEVVPALANFNSPWDMGVKVVLAKDYVEIEELKLQNESSNSYLKLKCFAEGISSQDSLNVELRKFDVVLSKGIISNIANTLPNLSKNVRNMMLNAGNLALNVEGSLRNSDVVEASGVIDTGIGGLDFYGKVGNLKTKRPHLMASINAGDLDLGTLLSTEKIGVTSFSVDADFIGLNKNADGYIDLNADYIVLNGKQFTGLTAHAKKTGNDMHAEVTSDDNDIMLEMEADCNLDGENSTFDAFLDIAGVNTDIFGMKGKFADSVVGFNLDAHAAGNNLDNLTGFLHISDFRLNKNDGRNLYLNNLSLNLDPLYAETDTLQTSSRRLSLKSDWLDANISGGIYPNLMAGEFKDMIASVFPTLMQDNRKLQATSHPMNDFTFDIEVKGKSELYDFLATPVCPLTEIPIRGYFDAKSGKFELSTATPHIRQGKDKLIRDTSLKISLDSFLGMAKVDAVTIFPAKKGDVQLALALSGQHDNLNANVILNPSMESSLKGSVSMAAAFGKIPNPITNKDDLTVHVDIIPSSISIKETIWNVANGKIDYFGKNIAVNNFLIEHGNQYVKIDGTASEKPDDFLKIKLNDIDLDYIFSILNINYVTFGGMATGEVVGSRLLTKNPSAHTKYLRVKNLSYNGAVLGNGDLASTYFPEEQEVGIYAVISDPLTRERRASIDGGIWVTRDSLSFTFDANKVNLQLMKPFVSAFCSDLQGVGSGKCKLYGTFSDIDLEGKLRADTISMKIDFTNTWYHAGGDSVFMGKGLIDVPPLTLYDTEGHTAKLSGWLRHRYFHEPEFNFKIRDAKSILCYDTNEKMNPLWYGTIYASGNGQIAGKPGLVDIDMNMTTNENSRFFYVISDAEDTGGYTFLSFTDKRKEKREAESSDSIPDYLHQFMHKVNAVDEGSSNVVVSLKGSVTNDALLTIVMDPIAGDKITARGQGALQMDYNMAANDLRMIGTYVLDEGNYYFTLQDIIIKNFTIKPGSSIKFDGDPMNANLDIAATYRVNTNLTDLDQSFAQDKELNRTNVPVDAILRVDGPMTHPDIDFDIELPTLTSDVERKVKSIVSTNDMMSRQIIYLLALNRFYTQEYTGGTSNSGAEWSSMASSTISSQLSNILSNMTDKLSVAPSFRSDKGDFSDMEFDLALSSRLLNNRLLINGNFGYRDKETSNTQFVGDFDIEYLLNKSGNLRLKAYNHFNDQNYYLRSALTTQGVGVVFRRDFNHLFNLGRNKTTKRSQELLLEKEQKDSTSKTVLIVKPKVSQSADTIEKRN